MQMQLRALATSGDKLGYALELQDKSNRNL
jgi:hypothetical protein